MVHFYPAMFEESTGSSVDSQANYETECSKQKQTGSYQEGFLILLSEYYTVEEAYKHLYQIKTKTFFDFKSIYKNTLNLY